MIYLYVFILVIVACLCIWYKPQKLQIITFGVFTAFSLILAIHLMGKPKPYWAVLEEDQVIIFSAQYNVGKAIYIWTGNNPPVYYILPWNNKTAIDINNGLRAAKKAGRAGVLMERSYDKNEYVVHPLPTKADPPKESNQ
jgi:hypothetical protein